MTEVLDDALAQEEILVPTTGRRSRRAFNDTDRSDGLAVLELLARQVEFDTAGQPVPPVKAMLVPGEVHLADHEVTSKDVVDDQGCDVAMAPGGVAWLPV